jgi:hypothetical protein
MHVGGEWWVKAVHSGANIVVCMADEKIIIERQEEAEEDIHH